MSMSRLLIVWTLGLFLLATPALAQFPPPGIYACTSNGAPFGELTLLVAGDYSFRAADGTIGTGQVASAGTDVDAISGPLKALGLKGAFLTDDVGATTFRFTGISGREVTCQ
jgi:hypothetical protein